MFSRSNVVARLSLTALILLVAAWIGFGSGLRGGLPEAYGQSIAPDSLGPPVCFEGTSTTPYVQPVVFAPSARHYIKAYPGPNGSMHVYISNGVREVSLYSGYVLALEADYISTAHSTIVAATVSDERCGATSNIHVLSAQLNDGASAFVHTFSYRSPHATGAYHRDICATGDTQTVIVMEGDNPVAPSNPPYVPGQNLQGSNVDAFARMQCPTLVWSAQEGFVQGPLQGCGDCGDLDGEPCGDPCFQTLGVMRAGQCDLSAATPLCDLATGQVCSLNGGAHCVEL